MPKLIFSVRAYCKHGLLTGQVLQKFCATLDPVVVVGKKLISVLFLHLANSIKEFGVIIIIPLID
jgi:hypothetical protein